MPVFYVITDYFNMSCRTIRSTKHTKINSDDCKYYEKFKKGYLAWKGEGDDDFFMEPGTILSRTDSSGAHRLRDELEPCTLAKISAEKSGDGFLLHEVLENHIQTDVKANPIIKEMTNSSHHP